MKTTRKEYKRDCTVIICFGFITVLDSRKNVLFAFHESNVHKYVWHENIRAYSHCTVTLEYHNHILEQVIIADMNDDEVFAHFDF